VSTTHVIDRTTHIGRTDHFASRRQAGRREAWDGRFVPAGDVYKLGRRPLLDGVRGLAVTMVVLSHCCVPLMVGAGMVGVTLFFVLSGFLITRLLLEEHARTGGINLRAFYLRRARRLVPALLLFLAVASMALARQGISPGEVITSLTYTSNLFRWTGINAKFLTHTWSLSMEEQFYLLWPFALVLLLRRRIAVLGGSLGVVAVAVAANRLWLSGHVADIQRVYLAPDVRADAIIVGCLLAVFIDRLSAMRWRVMAPIAAAAMVLCFPASESQLVVLLLPATLACAVVIMWAATSAASGWVRSCLWVRLGRISYGVYLWHMPIALPMLYRQVPWWVVTAVTVPASLVIASLSWRFLEAPILGAEWPRPTVSEATRTP